MRKTVYLSYFILFAILAQGITALLEDNVEKSSNLHGRSKRVIDKRRLRGSEISIHWASYMVNINRNGEHHCAGAILTVNMILTAAHCFDKRNESYIVLSGSALLNTGTRHSIENKVIHPGYNSVNLMYDLALFKVFPNIRLGIGFNRAAELIDSTPPVGTVATFSGWGCTSKIPLRFPKQITQTEIPIMHPRYCQEHYRTRNTQILDQHVCAFDRSGMRGSCTGDDGGPLVVEGTKLVGIFSHRNGELDGRTPDIFMNMGDREIHEWVVRTMQNTRNWFALGMANGNRHTYSSAQHRV